MLLFEYQKKRETAEDLANGDLSTLRKNIRTKDSGKERR